MTDRDGLLARIAADPALATLLAEARERDAALAVPDPTHDAAHLLRVAAWTLRLGGEGVDSREAIAAALLHDAVHVPKNSPERARASELAADHAAERLEALGFSPDAVTRIADAVRDHSFSRGAVPRTALGSALQDADRLEALGAIGIGRAFAYGGHDGRAMHDPARPPERHATFAQYKAAKGTTVNHFFEKLLLLRDRMNTRTGRSIAEKRHAFMERYLARFFAEWEGADAALAE